MTFGLVILNARKKKNLNLKDCAALILKEDGKPISYQYLNDVENGYRTPSKNVIRQLAKVLEVPIELLYFYAEMFPSNFDKNKVSSDVVVEAYREFFQKLGLDIVS